MSSLDFFAFDMEDMDDVNELLEQHHHHHHRHHRHRHRVPSLASSSTSARDLLSRMQFAQAMQQQQQDLLDDQHRHSQRSRHNQHPHQQRRGAAAAAAASLGGGGPLATTNLVDGLMNDDWNGMGGIGGVGGVGGLPFEFLDGDLLTDDAAVVGGDVGSPDHPIVGGVGVGASSSLPSMPPSSSMPMPLSMSMDPASLRSHPHHQHQHHRRAAPTVDDIVAAYWHGRATGAMASAGAVASSSSSGAVPAGGGGGVSAVPASIPTSVLPASSSSQSSLLARRHNHNHNRHNHSRHHHRNRHGRHDRQGHHRQPPFRAEGRAAAAYGPATAEALNAGLFRRWLHGDAVTGDVIDVDVDGGGSGGNGEATAASLGNGAGRSTGGSAAATRAPPLPEFSSPGRSPLASDGGGDGSAAAPASSDPYLASLLASSALPETATGESRPDAFAAADAVGLQNCIRDAETASSPLESRLELARANAFANAQNRDDEDEDDDVDDDEDEDINEDQDGGANAPGTKEESDAPPFAPEDLDDDSMGTVEALRNDGNDEEDNGEGEEGNADNDEDDVMPPLEDVANADVPPRPPPASAPSSAASGGEERAGAQPENEDLPAPPRRSRRQAAVRGLERISTALATHGMGVGESDGDDDVRGGSSGNATRPRAPPASSRRKRVPTIIPKPSNRNVAEKEKDEREEEKKEQPDPTCCICLEEPSHDELAQINGCIHPFCFTCIEKWADQENTCPLCKARFLKIERVNKPRKRKAAGAGSDNDGTMAGEGAENVRSSKRVMNRDQRTEIPSFINPLEGIFASMEANGTWPTHIAQLLFSGLGASSLGPGAARQARSAAATATHRGPNLPSIFDTDAFAAAAAARRQHRGGLSTLSHRTAGAAGFGYQTAAAAARTAAGTHAAGRSSRPRRYGVAAFAAAGTEGGPLPPSSPSALGLGANPYVASPTQVRAHRPGRRTVSSRMAGSASATGAGGNDRDQRRRYDASPWAEATLGARGFAGPAVPPSFQMFPNLDGIGDVGGRMMSSTANGATGSSPFLSGGEEEELLSTLSPSSYIRRLHQELEGDDAAATMRRDRSAAGQYQFNAFPPPPAGRAGRRNANRSAAPLAAPSPIDNPFSLFSAAPGPGAALPFRGQRRNRGHRNEWNGHTIRSSGGNHSALARNAARAAAGRSLETALEIESDDDDVVEVIDIM